MGLRAKNPGLHPHKKKKKTPHIITDLRSALKRVWTSPCMLHWQLWHNRPLLSSDGQAVLASAGFDCMVQKPHQPCPCCSCKLLGGVQRVCASLPDDIGVIGKLDADTALSRGTWTAALAAVGACCRAIDAVMDGTVGCPFLSTSCNYESEHKKS